MSAADRDELDIGDPQAWLVVLEGNDLVANVAAWSPVDDAETHEPAAFADSALRACDLARAWAAARLTMVQVLTHDVFAGDHSRPYPKHAQPAPRSTPGGAKAPGGLGREGPVAGVLDRGHPLVVWRSPANFVKTMARLAAQRDWVSVVDEQCGQPTWSLDPGCHRLVAAEEPYVTSDGTSSWGSRPGSLPSWGESLTRARPVVSPPAGPARSRAISHQQAQPAPTLQTGVCSTRSLP